ncbi:DUF2384 domain-containing protein [Pseudomonas sp. BN414]|uniref:MbcA/ParS/Xre antitoxin family protein n=1 Tax=Pseudomonas sp. BN414 TaxID=2567888 RepID=UPI002458CDAB|nr:MbcA/ParS/Xre antitoxin family protein [Pseudomonas sp. BN414]MDH4567927.1 DUF2384 domain-containing protein [Pseudomonas sp. BN414]
MQELNDAFLAAKYPKLVPTNKYAELCLFGFECGDGWLGLLDGTLSLLDGYASQRSVDVYLTQVKEKFGVLRIYSRGGDEYTELMIDIAELVSGTICEICGQRGAAWSSQGWISVRCAEHRLESPPSIAVHRSAFRKYSPAYFSTVAAVINLFGPIALRWVQEPVLALGNRKPFELLGNTEGCQEVLRLINQLEHGVYN